MKEIIIYEYQLKNIIEALRMTSNIHNCYEGKTCHDRTVRQAYEQAKNAMVGDRDKEVSYINPLYRP